MKVAILSESPADEAAIRILVAAILGRKTQEVSLEPIRTRGWSGVMNILPVVVPRLHYHTDADALAVVVDSDDSPIHQPSHDKSGGADMECRLCRLRYEVNLHTSKLRTVAGRSIIKTALGLAVPAIEAWYLCGLDPQVNEATWARKLAHENITYTRKSLKKHVYGYERPSRIVETTRAIEAANRLAADVPLLEQLFPNGFRAFADDVRSW